MDSYTEKEREILSQFCSNVDSNCFALVNLPEAVKGALFSRYSRSPKPLRRLLLDEFILNPETGFSEIVAFSAGKGESQLVATKKAEEFYNRVLVGYGDDSVAELGGAHLACENISILLTKLMQDSRIGISPLEKSTRYIYFDQKVDGNYLYLREKKIMASEYADDYIKACDLLFRTYASLVQPLSKIYEAKFPREESVTERAHAATIRAKVCDLLRGILPASTLTNAGFYGNGRAFEYLLVKMRASPLGEAHTVADESQRELSKVIPSFVKRASEKYGIELQNYLSQQQSEAAGQAKNYSRLAVAKIDQPHVDLLEYESDAEDKIISSILFPHLHADLSEVKELVAKMPPDERARIIRSYVGMRANRRQKPGRAFEAANYTFSVTGNFGMYRDLHRHRILTQERQLLTTKHGYDMPQELVDAGMDGKVREAVGVASELFARMEKEMPCEAQYAVPLGCLMRWYMRMNLREAYHFCELRSMRQGHTDYRKVAQDMSKLIKSVHPRLAEDMKFVDYGKYEFERLEAEKKIDGKLEALKSKK
jgi:thymidylate synthase ThyX